MDGFSPASPPRIFWNSRSRSVANGRSLQAELNKEENLKAATTGQAKEQESLTTSNTTASDADGQVNQMANLSEKRKALFEPLEPINGKRNPNEMLLPPPDFEPTSYPKGWLVGKKRKLVNVDVVESMRRIAVQEMNRKDREIDGLNEQLDEDSRCLETLQLQLNEERKKRAAVEKENAMLQEQVNMLTNMLDEDEAFDEDDVAPSNLP